MRIILVLACFSLAILAPTALSSATLGPVSVVLNNDLDPRTPVLSALLLSPAQSYLDAVAKCALLNEELLEISTDAHTQDVEIAEIVKGLQSKLNYAKSPCRNNLYWIRNNVVKAPATQCLVLSVTGTGTGNITKDDCTHSLPALCSNSNVQPNISDPVPTAAEVRVDAPVGTFVGFKTQQSFAFKGIKYAEAKRFLSPVPYAPPNGTIYNATAFGSVCPQQISHQSSSNGAEDCLFLNIYTPTLPGNEIQSREGLPVMFFIHGGGFMLGEGSLSIYNGQNLASRGNVVVVTINYRLGLLGAFDGTSSGFPHSVIPGNQASRDWITALKWVRRNIAHFGGSPDKVTIFGESAGGTAVRTLLSIPSAKGLFSSAIIESDPIDIPLSSLETGSGIAADYVNLLNCTMGDMACVTRQNITDLLNYTNIVFNEALKNNSHLNGGLLFKPVIDGDLIPNDFYDLIKAGKEDHVPIMIGSLRDEADYFIPDSPIPPNASTLVIPFALDKVFGVNRSELIMDAKIYIPDPKNPDGVRYLIGQILTDAFWTCPTQFIMSAHNATNDVYVYLMNRGFGVPVKYGGQKFCVGYACHSFDLFDVFGSQELVGLTNLTDFSADDVKYARIVQDRWIAFAHTGTPNPPFLTDVDVPWPKYTPANPNVMQFDMLPMVTEKYRPEFCSLMDKVNYDFRMHDQ